MTTTEPQLPTFAPDGTRLTDDNGVPISAHRSEGFGSVEMTSEDDE